MKKKSFLTGEVSRHYHKVICVTGGWVLAAAATSRRVLKEKTSGLLGGRGQSFGSQLLNLSKRLLQRQGDRRWHIKHRGGTYKLVIREGKGEKVVASMNANKTLHSSKKKVNTKISVFLQRSPLWEISAHKKNDKFKKVFGFFGDLLVFVLIPSGGNAGGNIRNNKHKPVVRRGETWKSCYKSWLMQSWANKSWSQ